MERSKSEDVENEEADEPMEDREATKFRGLAARANYLSLDRVDIQFTAKEICRRMSKPRKSHWRLLMRLGRYLLQYPRLVWKFTEGGSLGPEFLDVYSDSDWAGDKLTRKSTSGGVAAVDGGAVKTWSSTQSTIALSSGEAEYYALVKAAAEGLGIQAIARDLGFEMTIRLWVDSSAAKAVVGRVGAGKLRHVEATYLWIQSQVQSKKLKVRKVKRRRQSCGHLD